MNDELLTRRQRNKLDASHNPSDWLVSFHDSCCRASRRLISYHQLTCELVMMGPGPALEPDYSEPRPKGYDQQVLASLQKWDLVPKVRRKLEKDLLSGDEECGDIALKSYARWLLTYFLRTSQTCQWST